MVADKPCSLFSVSFVPAGFVADYDAQFSGSVNVVDVVEGNVSEVFEALPGSVQ